MKKTLLFSALLFSTVLTAQMVSDQVSLGADYITQSFYSLENGEVANVDNTNWNIAFTTDAFGSSIIINEGIGTELFYYGDEASWDSVDVSDIDTWAPLHNSDSDWLRGAFIQELDESNPFDYGWGVYNPVTHVVSATKTFIIRLEDETLKKIRIDELNFGVYTFTHADIDGSNETTVTANVADYDGKNFMYYSITNDEMLDREPASDSWDLTFTRYVEDLPAVGNYLVSGVLSNLEVTAAMVDGVPVEDAIWTDYAMVEDISEIGSDWKQFNNMTFQFELAQDRSYFVKDKVGNIWHLEFTAFGGSTTGVFEFQKEMISPVSIEESSSFDFGLYPNPATDEVTIVLPETNGNATISLRDMSGRLISADAANGRNLHSIELTGLVAGTYIVSVEIDKTSSHSMLVIH